MRRCYREQKFCRLCTSTDLTTVMDMGEQAVIDFPWGWQDAGVVLAPLRIAVCEACGLAQLRETVRRDIMYRQYWYRSGTSDTMVRALESVVQAARGSVPLTADDVVMDIGANDGTLLSYYPRDVVRVAVEPSQMAVSIEMADYRVFDYFSLEALKGKVRDTVEIQGVKIVTSIAMFYDVDRPLDFMADVAEILHPKGVWINQMNYLPTVMDNNAFDFISHEHLTYWTLRTLSWGLKKVGLEVFHMDTLPLNGGTARFYIQHKGVRAVSSKVGEYAKESRGYDKPTVWKDFAERVEKNGVRLRGTIRDIVASGKKVYVYGASTRGSTILHHYGLDSTVLPYAADKDKAKWGRYMVGTGGIKIISEEEARASLPDFFLVLPYSYIEEFKRRETEFLGRGGQFIVPLPEVHFVGRK